MKIELDTLKSVKMLISQGFDSQLAEGIVGTFIRSEIRNLYNKKEVFEKHDRQVEKASAEQRRCLKEQRREFDRCMAAYERKVDKQSAGTITTVGLALAGYLSALIHFIH